MSKSAIDETNNWTNERSKWTWTLKRYKVRHDKPKAQDGITNIFTTDLIGGRTV